MRVLGRLLAVLRLPLRRVPLRLLLAVLGLAVLGLAGRRRALLTARFVHGLAEQIFSAVASGLSLAAGVSLGTWLYRALNGMSRSERKASRVVET